MERRRISSLKQLELLVEFSEGNRDLALGRLRNKEARHVAVRLWKECSDKLNEYGPFRSPKEWAKVWNDLKSKVRNKLTSISLSEQTLEGPQNVTTLSALEKRVADIIIDVPYDSRYYVSQQGLAAASRNQLVDTEEQVLDPVIIENETSNMEEDSDEPDLKLGTYQEFSDIVEVEVVQLSADDPLASSEPQQKTPSQTSQPQTSVSQNSQTFILRTSPSHQKPKLQTATPLQPFRVQSAPLPGTLRLHNLSKQDAQKRQNLLRESPTQETLRLRTASLSKRPRLQMSPPPNSSPSEMSPRPQSPPTETSPPPLSHVLKNSPPQTPPLEMSPPPQSPQQEPLLLPQTRPVETSPPPQTRPMETSPPREIPSARHKRVRSRRKSTCGEFQTNTTGNHQLHESRMMIMKIEEMRARSDGMIAEAALRREEALKIQAEAALASAEADRLRAQVIATILNSVNTLVPAIRRYLDSLTKTRETSNSSDE